MKQENVNRPLQVCILNTMCRSGLYCLYFQNHPTELEGLQRMTRRVICYGMEGPCKEH